MSKHFKRNTHTPALQWIHLDKFRVQLLAQEHFDMQVTVYQTTDRGAVFTCLYLFLFILIVFAERERNSQT